jgi:hypothetical protein
MFIAYAILFDDAPTARDRELLKKRKESLML